MAATEFVDVDNGRTFKDLVATTDVVVSDSLKSLIFDSADDDFLMVRKRIGSAVTILSVKKVDLDLIKSVMK